MRYALHIDGAVPLQDVVDALAARGIHVRVDEANRIVANRIPAFLRSETENSNVVRMPGRVRKAKA